MGIKSRVLGSRKKPAKIFSTKMITKIKKYLLPVSMGVTGLVSSGVAFASDPFNLQAKIDSLTSSTSGYFDIMLTSFWPLIIGALIIVSVIGVVYMVIKRFFHHG